MKINWFTFTYQQQSSDRMSHILALWDMHKWSYKTYLSAHILLCKPVYDSYHYAEVDPNISPQSWRELH